MKVSEIYFGSAIKFRKSQHGALRAKEDKCSIVFDKGVFFISSNEDYMGHKVETVCVPTANVKQWTMAPDQAPAPSDIVGETTQPPAPPAAAPATEAAKATKKK